MANIISEFKDEYEANIPLLITQQDFDNRMSEFSQEQTRLTKTINAFTEQIHRREAIQSQKNTSCIVIRSDSNKQEIIDMLDIVKKRLITPQNNEKQFLESLQQKLEGAKNAITENTELKESISMPIAQSEQLLWQNLQNEYASQHIPNHIQVQKNRNQVIEELQRLLRNPDFLKLKISEQEVIKSIYKKFEPIINALDFDPEQDSTKQAISNVLTDTIEQAESTLISNAFKKIINSICSFFKIKPICSYKIGPKLEDKMFAMKEAIISLKEEKSSSTMDKDSANDSPPLIKR